MAKTNLTAFKLVIAIGLLFPLTLMAQEKRSDEIIAEGASKIKIKPDFVVFTLTVEKTDTSEK